MNNVKKSIGWCDFTVNPVKGLCPVGCSYCYARRAYSRNCNNVFKDKSIRFDDNVFSGIYKAKPKDRIFVGSTIDLFHPACSKWNDKILNFCKEWKWNTFIFLTKCPKNLPKEFPENCWVGVSATNHYDFAKGAMILKDIKAKVKLISFEPLKGHINPTADMGLETNNIFKDAGINWVIIGQQTPISKKTSPNIEWVKEIMEACDKAKIPVFLKDNLDKLFVKEYHKTFVTFKEETLPLLDLFYPVLVNEPDKRHLRQEFPEVK